MAAPRLTPSERTHPLAAHAGTPPAFQFVSIIAAMHARWEQLDQHYDAADLAHKHSGELTDLLIAEAMKDLSQEEALLQVAILHQRPSDDRDVAILACHLHWATDLLEASDFAKPFEPWARDLHSAVATAAEVIFEYCARQLGADSPGIGPQFQSAAERCASRRRNREGMFPEGAVTPVAIKDDERHLEGEVS
jgi:hypothetical protein